MTTYQNLLPAATAPAAPGAGRPQVEIVVPVRNEERDLGPSIARLHRYVHGVFPFSARITIADNGSTDRTWALAVSLSQKYPGVQAARLEEAGRGRALRAVWTASDADVLAYMDVDMSTDLNALLPLVAPLLSGHSDLAIGTRLARSARVARGPRREIISRCYNLLLHATLGSRFSDAQCGFKAIRADRARALLPLVQDTGWFFDTELLVLAERAGLRVHEVPVDWIDDPDSRVDLVATAVADLRGIARLGFGLARGTVGIPAFDDRTGRAGPAGWAGPASWAGHVGCTSPAGSAGPAGPADPADPASPACPANPADPASPACPANPADPASPACPADPADTASPAGPACPAGPADHSGPVGPAGRAVPLDHSVAPDGHRRQPGGFSGGQLIRFVVIGVASTAAYLLLYLLLRGMTGAETANAVSLFATAVANTTANRRFTFGIRGRARIVRHQVRGLLAFGAGLVLTSGALALLQAVAPHPSRLAELAVLLPANLIATLLRFLIYRGWVFGSAQRGPAVRRPVQAGDAAVAAARLTDTAGGTR